MGDQKMDLELLARKYEIEVNGHQEKLDEAKKRYTIVSEALKLLRKDGDIDQSQLFSPVISEKYKGMSMTDAIKDIIKFHPNHKVSAGDVFSELQKHGYKSKSKNNKRDVFTRLYRLRKNGKLICRIEKGIKKYCLPKD